MVASPIGNLEDITLRALRVLKEEVDVIACEDTRHSRKLLTRYEVQKRLISCRARNEEQSAAGIVNLLEQGQTVAYLSDAGTPGVSDPGARVVRIVREAGFPVVPLPGASAFTALMSVSGFGGRDVHFEGFFSPKSGKRKKRLQELLDRNESFVFYESPYRIIKVLREIAEISEERQILVGREMTKTHEELACGTARELAEDLSQGREKGEFAVLVSCPKKV